MKTSSLIPTLEDKYLSWMRDEKKTFDENFYKKNFFSGSVGGKWRHSELRLLNISPTLIRIFVLFLNTQCSPGFVDSTDFTKHPVNRKLLFLMRGGLVIQSTVFPKIINLVSMHF